MTQIGSSMEINKRIRGCPAISGQPLPIASAQYSLGTLPACMVNGVLPFQDDLRNGDKGIAFLKQIFNNTRQCFGSVFRSIVEQHNGTRLDFARHALCYFTRFQIFPIQAVTIPYKGKSLGAPDTINQCISTVRENSALLSPKLVRPKHKSLLS